MPGVGIKWRKFNLVVIARICVKCVLEKFFFGAPSVDLDGTEISVFPESAEPADKVRDNSLLNSVGLPNALLAGVNPNFGISCVKSGVFFFCLR